MQWLKRGVSNSSRPLYLCLVTVLQRQSCAGEVCGETWIHLWSAMPLHAKVLPESLFSVANKDGDACDSGSWVSVNEFIIATP